MKHVFLRPWLTGLLCALALPAWAAFTDNGNGTVTDTTTGLVWDKCSRGQTWDNTTPPGTCTGMANILSWADALRQSSTANTAKHRGQTDWRLPNRTELESLVKIDTLNPAIDTTVFPNLTGNRYWSATTYAGDPSDAWHVGFERGHSSAYGTRSSLYVRLVRSGRSFGTFDALGTAAPVLRAVGASGTSSNATTLQSISNAAATGYWVAVAQGSAEPTAEQVKAGVDYGAVSVVAAGNGAMAADYLRSVAVTGLAPSTAYTLYLVAEDAWGNLSTSPSWVNVTTLAPVVNAACGSARGVAALVAPAANLCSMGTASSVASNAADFTWDCAGTGGGSASVCSAPRQYSVTPVAGANGSMAPGSAQAVAYNAVTSFAVMPSGGYAIGAVSGCGGALVGNTYTTGAVTGACTVTANFAPVPTSFTGATVPSAGGTSGPVSASFTGGGPTCAFDAAGTAFVAAPAALPAGQSMPHGMFQFRLAGCTPGATVQMSVTWPQPVQSLSKWGKETAGALQSTHFTPANLVVSGNTTTFTVQDGQKGDDDWAANGTIVDPVGAVMAAAAPGGAHAVPTLGEWGLALLGLLAAALGAGGLRRRGLLRV